jgi:transcriptional regulator with XRE-family HTH domain
MRRLLAAHDIAGVYAFLHRYGVSQRTIAARTGQSQSEISEIMAGQRHVHMYAVLVRIADGLGIARGWMGLAFDETTEAYIPPAAS